MARLNRASRQSPIIKRVIVSAAGASDDTLPTSTFESENADLDDAFEDGVEYTAGVQCSPLDDEAATSSIGESSELTAGQVDWLDEADDAPQDWANAPPDQVDDLPARAELTLAFEEEAEADAQDVIAGPLSFPDDETGQTTGAAALPEDNVEPDGDDDQDFSGWQWRPLSAIGDESGETTGGRSLEGVDDDVVVDGDGEQGFTAESTLDDDTEDDPAFVPALSADADDELADDDAGLTAAPRDQVDDAPVAAAIAVDDETTDEDDAGIVARGLAAVGEETGETTGAGALPDDNVEPDGEDDQDFSGWQSRPVPALGDESGETTGARSLLEAVDDDVEGEEPGFTAEPAPDDDAEDDPAFAPAIDADADDDEVADDGAGLTATPRDQVDDTPFGAAAAHDDELADDDDGGVTAGPREDAPGATDSVPLPAGETLDELADDDVDVDGWLAAPRDDAPAVDATIVAGSIAQPDDDELDDPIGVTAGAPDQVDDTAQASTIAADDDADGDVDEGVQAQPLAALGEETGETTGAAELPDDNVEPDGDDDQDFSGWQWRPVPALGDESGETTGGRSLEPTDDEVDGDEPGFTAEPEPDDDAEDDPAFAAALAEDGDERDDDAEGWTARPRDQIDDAPFASVCETGVFDEDEDDAGLTATPLADGDDVVRIACLPDDVDDVADESEPGPTAVPLADAPVVPDDGAVLGTSVGQFEPELEPDAEGSAGAVAQAFVPPEGGVPVHVFTNRPRRHEFTSTVREHDFESPWRLREFVNARPSV